MKLIEDTVEDTTMINQEDDGINTGPNGDPDMELVYDDGYTASAIIYGRKWYMGSGEYRIMKRRAFYYWPVILKRINPQPHSCQRCKHRPVDFTRSTKRRFIPTVPPCPMWWYTKTAPFFDNPTCEQGEWEE